MIVILCLRESRSSKWVLGMGDEFIWKQEALWEFPTCNLCLNHGPSFTLGIYI